MKLIQDISNCKISDWRKHNFYVNNQGLQYKIGWDFTLPNGQRVHVLDQLLDEIFVWRNAIVVGVNQVEGLNNGNS